MRALSLRSVTAVLEAPRVYRQLANLGGHHDCTSMRPREALQSVRPHCPKRYSGEQRMIHDLIEWILPQDSIEDRYGAARTRLASYAVTKIAGAVIRR